MSTDTADDASERLRQRLKLGARRGAYVTQRSALDDDVGHGEDATRPSGEAEEPPRRLRPGVLPAPMPRSADERSAPVPPSARPEPVMSASPLARLREVAQQEQVQEKSSADFRRNMAALRSLGRLMEAVYVRPGAKAPEMDRILALRQLAGVSRELSGELLQAIGNTVDSRYARAMAMEAVIDLVARTWEEQDRDEEDPQWLSERPLELIRSAAVDTEVVQAAMELAEKTWNPVQTKDQYREVLALAAHKSYWRLYMLGENVNGMSEERCRSIASKLMQYLKTYPHPRGESPDMRSNWMAASMGRLTSLVCAELRGRHGIDGNARYIPSEQDIEECMDVAIMGFEGIEEHAAKLLESAEGTPERPVDCPDVDA